jgi:hypothetical protein
VTLAKPCKDEPGDTTWPALVDELIAFRARDVELDIPDGYPAGGVGGDGFLTPTEAAAAARMKAATDAYHDSTAKAVEFMLQAVQSANAVMNRVRLLRELVKERPPEVKHCQICKRAGIEHPPEERTTFGGVAQLSMDVCGPSRDFVDRQVKKWRRNHGGRTPALADVLPTVGQIRGHAETDYWREHVDPKAKV